MARQTKSRTGNCPQWRGHSENPSESFKALIQKVRKRAIEESRERCPDLTTIKSWHKELFETTVPLPYYAGNFRQWNPDRLCLAINVRVGRLPGFPFHIVSAEMALLSLHLTSAVDTLADRWIEGKVSNFTQELATIVGVGVARFVHIHPFLNGNGRTSRILWTSLLSRFGFSPRFSIVRRPGPPYSRVMADAMAGNYGSAVAMILLSLANTPRSITR